MPADDFAEAMNNAQMDPMDYLQFTPTCVSQNFICFYMIEASLKHQSFFAKPTKLEFEVFLENSEQSLAIIEKLHKSLLNYTTSSP